MSSGNSLTLAQMLSEVRKLHEQFGLDDDGGEDMVYRVALMAEELGEISACVSKGLGKQALSEECADLMILLLGNAIAADFDIEKAFIDKMAKLQHRKREVIDGRVRIKKYD